MLRNLTERLIKDSVEKYNNNLLIEGIELGCNLSDIKRYSCMSNDCDDKELETFKNALLSVNFPEDMSVDDRKNYLRERMTKPNESSVSTITEGDTKTIDERIRDYRVQYINACKENNDEAKDRIISRLKALERIKNK